jgi:RNA polymerase-binding transcription factor DksA
MTKEKLKELENKLGKEQALILAEIKQNEKPVDFGTDVDHFEEESDEAEEMGNQLAVAEDLKKRLEDIVEALEKIKNGGYGICEKCKKEIELEILEIDPESRLCKNCKLKA